MTKGKTGRGWHIRWEPAEWLKVAAMAVHLIETQGQNATEAVSNASRAVLAPHRWQTPERIKQATSAASYGDVWRKYSAQVLLKTPQEREAILLAEIHSPKPSKAYLAEQEALKAKESARALSAEQVAKRTATFKANRAALLAARAAKGELAHHERRATAPPYRPLPAPEHKAKWTKREWALIARAVEWIAQQYPESTPWEQVVYAQQILGPDLVRPRAISGIKQTQYKSKADGLGLRELLQAGKNDAWLIANIPFVPPGSEPETTEAAAEPEAPAPVATPEPAEAPPAAPSAPAATVAPPAVHSTIAEASKAFAETMLGALDRLLTTHSRVLLEEVNVRIAASAEHMGTKVAALIQQGMQEAVHQMMQHELGGPINPPSPPAVSQTADKPSAPLPPGAQEAQRARVKVDVIGALTPIVRNQVRDQFSNGVDIRFFDGDHHTRYKPVDGRHIIFLSKRSTHGTFDKLKKHGVKPIFVEPSASLINHAIEELQRSAHQ